MSAYPYQIACLAYHRQWLQYDNPSSGSSSNPSIRFTRPSSSTTLSPPSKNSVVLSGASSSLPVRGVNLLAPTLCPAWFPSVFQQTL